MKNDSLRGWNAGHPGKIPKHVISTSGRNLNQKKDFSLRFEMTNHPLVLMLRVSPPAPEPLSALKNAANEKAALQGEAARGA